MILAWNFKISSTTCGHLSQPLLACCPPQWSGIPIAPAHFSTQFSLECSSTVSSSLYCPKTQKCCRSTISTGVIISGYDTILFIFDWNKQQTKFEKKNWKEQKTPPELHNGAQWIGKQKILFWLILHNDIWRVHNAAWYNAMQLLACIEECL